MIHYFTLELLINTDFYIYISLENKLESIAACDELEEISLGYFIIRLHPFLLWVK